MKSIAQNKRYCPHKITTKYHARTALAFACSSVHKYNDGDIKKRFFQKKMSQIIKKRHYIKVRHHNPK